MPHDAVESEEASFQTPKQFNDFRRYKRRLDTCNRSEDEDTSQAETSQAGSSQYSFADLSSNAGGTYFPSNNKRQRVQGEYRDSSAGATGQVFLSPTDDDSDANDTTAAVAHFHKKSPSRGTTSPESTELSDIEDAEDETQQVVMIQMEATSMQIESLADRMEQTWSLTNLKALRRNNIYGKASTTKQAKRAVMRALRRNSKQEQEG
jgi:hypothetical protein